MATHARDSDCTLDAAHVCTECGVWHGAPCLKCGARGYHTNGCAYFEPLLVAARLVGWWARRRSST